MCLLGVTLLASLFVSSYGSLRTKLDSCPELRAPNYGAIACYKWETGTKCTISCRQGYDIPQSVHIVTKVYVCETSTGRWNNDQVPDCEWHEPGERIRMRGYYYFTGHCCSATETIKRNFLSVIDEYNVCSSEKDCTMGNVSVKCGEEPDAWWWKRSLKNRRIGRANFQRQSKN